MVYSAGEVRAPSPAREASVATVLISEASVAAVVVDEERSDWSVVSAEFSVAEAVLVVEVEPVVDVEPVVLEVVGVGRVYPRTILRPAGTCDSASIDETAAGRVEPIDVDRPAGRLDMDVVPPVVAIELPLMVVVGKISGSWAMAAAVTPAEACARASTLRSLSSALMLPPPCSLWTQWVNWAPEGLVPRMDSNAAVTLWPAGVSASGLATSAAFPPPRRAAPGPRGTRRIRRPTG